jgi:protein phosphatase
MRLAAGFFTDVGQIREINEDTPLVDPQLALFAVADGMGGHRGGEIASSTAIEALRASVASGRPINEAIERANDAILERASGSAALAGMGTTLTAVVVAGTRRLLIGHVGDSRAYLMRDGTLQRVTDDHSLVEELVREGRLTPEQAEAHPQRAIITRALGVDDEVEVDLYTVSVENDDRLILCSDGLTTMLRDREIERIARGEGDPQRASEALVDAANSAGGEDNITVVVVDVVEVGATDKPDPEALDASLTPMAADVAVPEGFVPLEPPAPEAEPVTRSHWRGARGLVLAIVPVVAILGVAIVALGWYARRSYYVGALAGEVVVYQGVPGGVLGWDPTVERRTGIQIADLPEVDRDRVANGAARGSRARAESFVTRLEERIEETTTTTTTRPVTTTTRRPATTTTVRATTPTT